MKYLFSLALVACGVRNPEAKAFYDEVEQGSQWKLTFGSGVVWDENYGYPGPCPPIAPKLAHVPDSQTTGCDPGCTCEFIFAFDATLHDRAVVSMLTQQCADDSHVECEDDDPEHDDTGECYWFVANNPDDPDPADCVYPMTETRE
jgi:hypothetical protein